MTRQDRRRIVRELCDGLQERLRDNVDRFPDDWDGHEIRALAAYLLEQHWAGTAARPYKRTLARMRRSGVWFELPL